MTSNGRLLVLAVAAAMGLVVYGVGAVASRLAAHGPTAHARHADDDADDADDGPDGEADGDEADEPGEAAADDRQEPDAQYGVLATAPESKGFEIACADPKVRNLIAECDSLAANDAGLVKAWEGYNSVLGQGLSATDSRIIKARINRVTDRLIYGGANSEGLDRFFATHVIRPGERLTSVANQHKLSWELIARINNVDPGKLRSGQALRVLDGPLTVVVYKSEYELDVLLNGKVVRAYAVGHGKNNCTPVGKWLVRSKMKNPQYTHPHTGERFAGGDPRNPVGTRYMGLEGLDDKTRPLTGFALHGTIEPESIGTQSSLGCVRLVKEDAEELYDLLTAGATTVEIRE